MWIQEIENSKGLRYKYTERFENPITGKYITVSVTLNSQSRQVQKQARLMLQKKFDEKIDKLDTKKNHINKLHALTVHQVIDEWLEHIKPTIKESTYIIRVNTIKKIKKAVTSDLKFLDFTPATVEKILYNMYYTENLSANYTNIMLALVKNIMKYAQRAEYIQDITKYNDIKLKKKPASEKDLKKSADKFLDRAELKEVLKQLKNINPRISLMMEFIALTGLRYGELVGLRIQDYDKANNKININGSFSKTSKERTTPKNKYSYREVYLNDRATQIIDKFILQNKMLAWNKCYKDKGYIFTNTCGNPLDLFYTNSRLKKVKVNDKILSSHIFRHTHITLLIEMNTPLKSIMQRVGHHDIKTTMEIYTHYSSKMNEELKAKVNLLRI